MKAINHVFRPLLLGQQRIVLAILFAFGFTAWAVGRLLAQDQLPPPPLPVDPNAASIAPAMPNDPNAEVLARGPIHEAFATPAGAQPSAGFIVPKQPPQMIEEVPPEVKPAGENVTWVPGYWGWDDDRKDYLWVSGVWRVPPPGHRWMPGYWQPAPNGVQWVSGYWMPSQVEQVSYLPPPPQTLENGPVGVAPGPNFFWVSGHFQWQGGRYVWMPGYYAAIQPNWIYAPASYYWTPRGYVFVPGHWDYTFETRGLCYSPVYFNGPVTVYRPSVCVDVGVLSFSLFARPAYCHYYFGDYYDGAYVGLGFSPWYAEYHHGYDPFFAYYRWDHVYYRHEPGWDNHLRGWGEYYRSHPDMRPPHTYAAQVALLNSPAGRARPDFHQLGFVQSSRELSRDPHAFVRTEAVSARQAAAIRESVHETRNFSAQRQGLEAHGVAGGPRGEDRVNFGNVPSFHSNKLPGAAPLQANTGPAGGGPGGARAEDGRIAPAAGGRVPANIGHPALTPPPAKPKPEKRTDERRAEDRKTDDKRPERTFAGNVENKPPVTTLPVPERRTPVVVERRPVVETKPAPAHAAVSESHPAPAAHNEPNRERGGEPAGNHREKDIKNNVR